MSITILADDAYYSAPTHTDTTAHSSTDDHKTTPQPFTNHHIPLSSAHKTGLGSSAALVTSLIASLLTHTLPRHTFTLPQTSQAQTDRTTPSRSKAVLHNLSQTAHSTAQGKIGSGFDIASAVYGSCTYRRFSPSILTSVPEPGDSGFATALRHVVESPADGSAEAGSSEVGGRAVRWDQRIDTDAARMPRGLRLVMCDVDAGSATPGMVRKVLVWRERSRGEADEIWEGLQGVNDEFVGELGRLGGGDGDGVTAGTSPETLNTDALRAHLTQMQSLQSRMSTSAGVPILPQPQAALLHTLITDERTKDFVVGGVVPGAGGYDALVLVVRDVEGEGDATDTPREDGSLRRLKEYLDGVWNGGKDSEGMVVRPLDVREDRGGGCLREEGGDAMYEGWV